MPFVTSAIDRALQPLSYPFESREDALVKAVELAKMGSENVSVTDIETGEVLTGEEIVAAVEALGSRPE
jgi:hypothetical protein